MHFFGTVYSVKGKQIFKTVCHSTWKPILLMNSSVDENVVYVYLVIVLF